MYHNTIQPGMTTMAPGFYHSHEYPQYTLSTHGKNDNLTNLTTPKEYPPQIQNVVIPAPENIINEQPLPKKTTTKNRKSKTSTKPKTDVDTSIFSIEERLVAAVWVHDRHRTGTGICQIQRDFRDRFGREPPTTSTLLAWEKKLFTTGNVSDAPRPGRPVHRLQHVHAVSESVAAAPSLSLRARAAALRLPRSTLRKLLRHDLPGKQQEKSQGSMSKEKRTCPSKTDLVPK